MAKAEAAPTISVKCTFTVDEEEARALDALAGYGADAFVKAFYESLGEGYMKRHEAGLRRFLSTIQDAVQPAMCRVDKARDLLAGKAFTN